MNTTLSARPLVRASGRDRAPGGRRAGWRATLRLARRELMRAKGRALLVVALIAVPVGAMVFAEVMIRTANLTSHQRDLIGLGSAADARLDIFNLAANDRATGADTLADVEHTDVTQLYFGRMKVGEKFRYVSLHVADLANPLLRGAYDLTAGTAPLTGDEAAVSESAARRYHVAVGDHVTLRRTGQAWTVTGIFRFAEQIDADAVILRMPPAGVFPNEQIRRFVRAPAGRLAGISPSNINVVARERTAAPGSEGFDNRRYVAILGLYTAGTVALAIVGIVVSAAFAAGARRQLRTLGLAAASGGTPSDVRRVVLAQGAFTGVLGAVAGFGLGALGVAAMAPRLNRLINFVVPGLRTRPVDLAIIAALAITAATLAAAAPAIGAGRAPVLVALAGRRPLAPLRNSVPVAGVVLFVGGLVGLGTAARGSSGDSVRSLIAYTAAALAVLLGAVLSTPRIIARLDRLAPHLRGPARLAARTMTRSRGRTGPIASAILVTVGAAAFVATTAAARSVPKGGSRPDESRVLLSTIANTPEDLTTATSIPADVAARVLAIVGGSAPYAYVYLYDPSSATRHSQWAVTSPTTTSVAPETPDGAGTLVSSDRASLAAMGVPVATIEAWEHGSALVLGPGLVVGGHVGFGRVDEATSRGVPATTTPTENRSVDAVELPTLVTDYRYGGAQICDPSGCRTITAPPLVVMPDALVAEFALARTGPTVVMRAAHPLTSSQRRQLRQLQSDLGDEAESAVERGGDDVRVQIQFADEPSSKRLFQLLLLLTATGAALGVTAIGLALSAAEGRADDATLLALGAPPRLRRSLRAWEALMTSGIGAVLGVTLGAMAGAVFVVQHNRSNGGRTDLRFPWSTALGLGLALPIVAAIVFWLATWPRRAVLLRDD